MSELAILEVVTGHANGENFVNNTLLDLDDQQDLQLLLNIKAAIKIVGHDYNPMDSSTNSLSEELDEDLCSVCAFLDYPYTSKLVSVKLYKVELLKDYFA